MSIQPVAKRRAHAKTEVGKRLLALIEAKGFRNPSEAATATGVNRQVLQNIFAGKEPRITTLEKIVEQLGSNMVEFYSVKVE